MTLDELLFSLIPDPLPLPRGRDDNAIHHLNIAIFGKPNSGKTSIANSIYAAMEHKYGTANVKAMRSTRDLPALFNHLDDITRYVKPTAVVLFADDMTKALDKLSGTITIQGSIVVANTKVNKKAYWMDKWYDIRGELKRRGMNRGVVLMVGAVHRFYGMPIDMRSDVDLLLVRSTATPGTFDSRTVQRMLGGETYGLLRVHEQAALRNREELSWTGYATKNSAGIMEIFPTSEIIPTVASRPPRRRGRLLHNAAGVVTTITGALIALWLLFRR